MENKKLTDKQERFIQEYMIDFNATQSAIRAGYSAKTAYSIGEENLRKPEIKLRIEELQAEVIKDIKITKERLLNDLNDILAINKFEPKGAFAALKAIEILNKMLGYNEPEKVQNEISITNKLSELIDFEDGEGNTE